jgi:hypothetical protein
VRPLLAAYYRAIVEYDGYSPSARPLAKLLLCFCVAAGFGSASTVLLCLLFAFILSFSVSRSLPLTPVNPKACLERFAYSRARGHGQVAGGTGA